MRLAAALLVLGVVAGCATQEDAISRTAVMSPPAEILIFAEAMHIADPGFRAEGSAVPFGENLLLTARHAVPIGKELLLNGKQVTFDLLKAGEGAGPESDWAYIRVNGVRSRVRVDFDSPLPAGRPIYLVGYWWAKEGKSAFPRPPCVVCGEVLAKKGSWDLPEQVLPVALPHESLLSGMSGGAALTINPVTNEPVLVGIYKGRKEWRLFGSVLASVHEVVRPAWRP